ncbi:hypothetical protein BKA93DRAFT_797484, partial [Sparassis latifolia]
YPPKSSLLCAALASSSLAFLPRDSLPREAARSVTATTQAATSSVDTLGGFDNVANERYTGDITVGGYSVILDTGSNDLWVDTAGYSFAEGFVLQTNVTFSNYTVDLVFSKWAVRYPYVRIHDTHTFHAQSTHST